MQEAIAERIRRICAERHINQHQLARLAAISPSTLKNILYGTSQQPGVITIKKICDGLDMSVREFFSHDLFRKLEKRNPLPPPENAIPPLMMHDAVAQRFASLCRENNLFPSVWSVLAGLSEATMRGIFNGKSKNTSMVVIKNLCDVIDMSLEEFFDHELFHNLDLEIEHEPDEDKP